ncbi:MAG: 6-phosphogluconolactonase [Armatimonadetes bacterium]|nr:6-phosphogluconolactonase [Armatimonadota bacterium]
MKPEVVVLADAEALAAEAARRFTAAARAAVAARGRFAVALSGGSTPLATYRLLAEEDLLSPEELAACHWFWGDERCVPPDHPDSNFREAWEAGLKRLTGGDESRVYRFWCEKGPEKAAEEYEAALREFFSPALGEVPRFDLVLLGLGADGHTASLFPGTTALEEQERWAVPVWVPKLESWRATLTLAVINAAREVMFLVAGEAKAEAVQQCLAGPLGERALPAQRVVPREGKLVWLLDAAAARLLTEAESPEGNDSADQ